jgi:positive regulator of sigma E activity
MCQLGLLVLWQDLKRSCDSQDAGEVSGQSSVGKLSDHETDLKCFVEISPGDSIMLELMEVGEDSLVAIVDFVGDSVVVLVGDTLFDDKILMLVV